LPISDRDEMRRLNPGLHAAGDLASTVNTVNGM
jgi:hypothetical protein